MFASVLRIVASLLLMAASLAGARAQGVSQGVWVPDYFGRSVQVYSVEPHARPSVTKWSFATRNCNPNAIVVPAPSSVAYVVCNNFFGNPDAVLVYSLKRVRNVPIATLHATITSTLFSSLVGGALDARGNLWVSSFANNFLLRIPASSLKRSAPRVDRVVIHSPDAPAGIAIGPDKSFWVVGQCAECGNGIVVNFPDSVLNQPGTFGPGNPLDPNPTYCIANGAADCQSQGGLFNSPEGVAVLNGNVWVSNNGGNEPAKTLVELVPGANDTLTASVHGSVVDKPFACPGGLAVYANSLWVNDEGYGVPNTDCGASSRDRSAAIGRVMVFSAASLAASQTHPAPTKFPGWNTLTTSSPGFGGISVNCCARPPA
jgi:hypothetical protein